METISVRSIIEKAGGPAVICRQAEGRLTVWAVYKWFRGGIPQKHWPLVLRLSGVTATEMLAANQALLGEAPTPPSEVAA